MKQIRFAVVGLGNIARTHIIALRALPVIKKLPYVPVLDTLVTSHPEENEAQAYAMGFQHVTASLIEAITSRDFDIVDICTPNALHLEAVKDAISGNKAIYCEKPLTENYSHSRQLVSIASVGSERHQVALVYRYHPAVMRIREALRHGLIGEVLQCNMSYRRSGYLNAERPVSWRLRDDLSGGGAITDLGVHVLDLVRYLLGEIADIKGDVNTFVKNRPVQPGGEQRVDIKVDDWAMMHLTLESGVKGTAEVSRIAWGSESFHVHIYGTRGSIICDLEKEYHPTVKLLDGSNPVVPNPPTLALVPDDKSTMGMSVDSHFGALNHFLQRLMGRDPWDGLAPTLEDCLRAEQLIDQVLSSC